MAGDLKHSDSSGCESMRRFNNYYTRQFIDRLLNQHNRNMATITNSRLSVDVQIQTKKKLTEAFDVANKHFTKLATHHAHDLNKNCTLTNAMSVVDHCNSNIGALSMRQLDAASQLVAMPMQFDRDLQSAYAKAEPYVLQFWSLSMRYIETCGRFFFGIFCCRTYLYYQYTNIIKNTISIIINIRILLLKTRYVPSIQKIYAKLRFCSSQIEEISLIRFRSSHTVFIFIWNLAPLLVYN